ncbi:P-loop containing nucleoside triphosphate hydrolase protein, partial [Leptodontidium sp. 2 PMI_412]
MSGLEVLGAVSAATALAEQCGKVIKFACDVYSKYQNPDVVKKQLVQLQQLVDLSILIKQNPSLQTTEMESLLSSCLTDIGTFRAKLIKIKSNFFDSRLRKLKKSIAAVMQENDVKDLFANLEQHKSSLALCIAEIDSSLLHSIGIDISKVEQTVRQVANDVTEIKTTVLTINQKITATPQPIEMTARIFYEVPNRRVDCFVGREDVLQKIEDGPTSEAEPRIFVLRGLGGQGKTQIALEHCRRAKNRDVKAIFWVDSTSEESVKKSFQTIAGKLKGTEETATGDATPFILETFREWPSPWVMVFDNYDDIKNFDSIRDYFPASKQGTIIITSRSSASNRLTNHQPRNFIELEGLSEEDSLQLLWTQCGLDKTDEGSIAAKAIIELLVHHPLAITQAGSYIGRQKLRLDQFKDHYNKSRDKILKHTPQLSQYRRHLNKDEKETSLNVFTTWELSMQQLIESAESGKDKADLLTLFAFFDCKDISEQLFSAYTQRAQIFTGYHWPVHCLLDGLKQWDSESFGEILNDLSELSLVQSWAWGEDEYRHLSLHPLIKDWIRIRSNDEETHQYALISSKVLQATLDANLHHKSFSFPLSTQQILLSHIDTYEQNISILQGRALVNLDTWHESGLDSVDESVGEFLLHCGRYAKFEDIMKRLIDFSTQAFGLENEDTLKYMNNIAIAYTLQGKLDLAEDVYRQVLKGTRTLLGSDHARTLSSISALAMILLYMGKYEEAEKHARVAAEWQERTLGIENEDTLRSLHRVGSILQMRREYEKSEEVLKRALEGRKKLLGLNHPNTLNTVEALGTLLQD